MPGWLNSHLCIWKLRMSSFWTSWVSRLLVNEQREIVQQLNEIVRATPQFRQSSAAGKLIRIATGDGMALVFFQSPEEPVHCAMEIARALKKSHPHSPPHGCA